MAFFSAFFSLAQTIVTSWRNKQADHDDLYIIYALMGAKI